MFTGSWIFFEVWKKSIFSSTTGDAQCVDMQIHYIIQTRYGEIIC